MPPEGRANSAAAHGVVADATFKPTPWLPGPHLPTIWASACRRIPALDLERERIELPDGDFVDLDWTRDNGGAVVVILHGLEGSHESAYARGMLAALEHAGYRGVLLNFRSCSGVPNRLDRNYHSGDTGDVAFIVELIDQRSNQRPFAAVGYSLGGNVLLKWLGELGSQVRLTTAVAVSVPFELGACATRLDQGFSRVYQWRLVRSMKNKFKEKFRDRPAPLDLDDVDSLDTFWTYDDAVTAPLHGFKDVHDYYASSSSRQFLGRIELPTLILHAKNDPFVPASAIPTAQELGAKVTVELCRGGGHVGFVSGWLPGRYEYWLEQRIVRHLNNCATPA